MGSRWLVALAALIGAAAGVGFTALSYTRTGRIYYYLASPGIRMDLAVGAPYHPYPTLSAPFNAAFYALAAVGVLLLIRRVARDSAA